MARYAGAPAVLVAKSAWVVVVLVAATTAVPVNAGRLIVVEPSAPVTGLTATVPDVAFLKSTSPTLVPATPRVKTLTPSVVMPATVDGVAPAPPPRTGEFAVSAAEDARVPEAVKPSMP